MNKQAVVSDDKNYIAGSYNRFDVLFETGENATLFDESGKQYTDFASGIGVNCLGVSDKGWAEAVYRQLTKLSHVSNLFYTEPQTKVAEKLCGMSGLKKVFFSNSGAEANECAVKVARKYSFDKYGQGRYEIITLNNSFHGRTITTLKATGQEKFHNYFFPFTEGFVYADPDLESVKAAVSGKTCAIMVEGVQGEGGVNPLDPDFVKGVEILAREKDLLLIFDEVQTGMARTGRMFCYQNFGVTPDIVTLAKGLGGGLPVGACLMGDKCENVLTFGSHGSTFGGNPAVMAGALYVLSVIGEQPFLDRVSEVGAKIKATVESLGLPFVAAVRGMGMMIGVGLDESVKAAELSAKLLGRGLVTLTAGNNTLRLLPPLSITDKELERGLKILVDTLGDIK